MAHKTAHRKRLEAYGREQAKLRAQEVERLQESTTLKPYAGRERNKDGR
jgi:hypothetical protein